MKKYNTVFVDLKGDIEDYVSKIYTKTKTRDTEIQNLQTRLNVLIKQSGNLQASAVNLKNLWNNLTDIMKGEAVTNRNDIAYQEIVQSVVEIGETIAFICKRRRGGWKNTPINFYSHYTDEDTLNAFKIVLLNQYNNGEFKKDKDGNLYCVSNGWSGEIESGIKHTLINDVSTMTDEELMPWAIKCKEDKLGKRDNKFTSPITYNEKNKEVSPNRTQSEYTDFFIVNNTGTDDFFSF